MDEEIQKSLTQIEHIHGVKIIYAVESGSRVWGFDSPNSDYDVRFIYVRPLSWYLSIRDRRDVIEIPADGLLDVTGWDLKKALFLMAKSNPPLLEWLASPVVYRHTLIVNKLRALAIDYFNARSTIYHYLHMANGNYRTYLRDDYVLLKKYFYVIRPLLCCKWVEQTSAWPPVEFNYLLPQADWSNEVADMVTDLLKRKRAGEELTIGKRLDPLNAWIEAKLAHYAEAARTTAKGKNPLDDLDDMLMTALMGEIMA
jgi:uncharacterized protein